MQQLNCQYSGNSGFISSSFGENRLLKPRIRLHLCQVRYKSLQPLKMMKFSQYLELVNTSTTVVNYLFQNIGNLQAHEMKNLKNRVATPYNGSGGGASHSSGSRFTLQSSVPPIKLDEHEATLTLSEYLIQRAKYWVGQGKSDWIVDVESGICNAYANFEVQTRSIASFLNKRGMRKGDTAIYMTFDMVYLHLFATGVWRANGIVRATYPEEDEETLLNRVEESRVGWILCDPETADLCLTVAAQIYWGVEVIVMGAASGCTSFSELLEDDGREVPDLLVEPKDIALILCTSGTTGKSKGAAHTHQTFMNQIKTLSALPWFEAKPNLLVSKGTHITGILFPLCTFISGKTALVMANINKDNVLKAVDKYKPGLIWGFPTFLLVLVNDPDASKYDVSSIEVCASGGAPVTPAIEGTLLKLPNVQSVINVYGLTEAVPLISSFDFTNPGGKQKIPGAPTFTVGKVYPGVALQIRDMSTGAPLGPNKRGEICVRASTVFHSYYKNPVATRGTFVDGWFKTGDVGMYDINGFLFIVDRMKEIFKYYNNHISPTELEDTISKHPGVAEACVVGVPDPDGGDHIPRAFVTLKPGATCSADEIRGFANGKLASYKHLRGGVYILEELPKGKTGKVTRQLAAKLKVPDEAIIAKEAGETEE